MSDASQARWLNVVTAAPPRVTQPQDLIAIAGCADVIELRLDLLPIPSTDDLLEWIDAAPRPVLATMRTQAQGGAFAGTAEACRVWLRAAIASGAAFIDLEPRDWDAFDDIDPRCTRVASVHLGRHGGELADTPSARRPRLGAFIKRAIPVEGAPDLGDALALTRADGFVVPFGGFGALRGMFVGMGRQDELLFGAVELGSAGAPGQPPLQPLLDELRAGEVSLRARLFGLVGNPPAWSPSPAMHNAVFRAEDRDALYAPLPGVDLANAAEALQGLSVTSPHKGAAFAMVEEHDTWARRSGSVNTIVRRDDGSLLGIDTDARAIASLVGSPAADRRRAFVYGAGGYARCAVAALAAQGYDVRIGARAEAAGRALAKELAVAWAGPHYIRATGDALVFNATPAGAVDDVVPVAADASLRDLSVVDAPYRDGAEPTALVTRAEHDDAGVVIDGRTLLLEQALHQAMAFGSRLEHGALRRIMRLGLFPPANLWLVGLRGSGKSTVGRAVARRLGRPFVDLDTECLRVTGRTPAQIIEAEGWDHFRRIEAERFAPLVHRRGVVVATGGGLVTTAATAEALERLPHVLYLSVDAARAARRVAASDTERPPLPRTSGGIEESRSTWAARDPIYRRVANHIVDAEPDVESVAREVMRLWVGG